MRVGDLIEHHERALAVGIDLLLQQVTEIDVLERIDLDHQPLMRCVTRDQPREVGNLGVANRNHRGQVELPQRFARSPDAFDGAFGIGERRQNGVTAPETDGLAAGAWALRATVTGNLSHSARLSHDCH